MNSNREIDTLFKSLSTVEGFVQDAKADSSLAKKFQKTHPGKDVCAIMLGEISMVRTGITEKIDQNRQLLKDIISGLKKHILFFETNASDLKEEKKSVCNGLLKELEQFEKKLIL